MGLAACFSCGYHLPFIIGIFLKSLWIVDLKSIDSKVLLLLFASFLRYNNLKHFCKFILYPILALYFAMAIY